MNENWLNLDGAVVVVTGGASGIGKHVVDTLVKVGAQAVVVDMNVQTGDQMDGAYCVQCNVTDAVSVQAMADAVMEKFGRIDALVNNAGITRDGLMIRLGAEKWNEVIQANLNSVFYMTSAIGAQMMRKKAGSIVNITSISGLHGNFGQANYTAAKAGVIGLTKTAAKELGSRGIRVNAVAPGFIQTDMTDALSDEIKENAKSRIALGRFGKPEEIAEAVAFLASDKASYITGQVLSVDGSTAL